MEIAIIVITSFLCVLALINLMLLIRNNHKKTEKFSNDDLERIRKSVNESVSGLVSPISDLITIKNSTMMEKIDKKLDELIKEQESLTRNFNIYKEDTNKLINDFNNKTNKFLVDFTKQSSVDNAKQKEEIMDKLSKEIKQFNETVKVTLEDFNKSLKEKLDEFKLATNESMKSLSESVNKDLIEIRKDNSEKLDKINESVNEKLQKTLEDKLKDSFKSVIEGIGNVNKAVGEMKAIATDVNSLKNVLTNVKTKGIMGEVILGNIIKEILTTNQYEENVVTKLGSNERVEFAIKLPGNKDQCIYLPIDSKFPYEPYSKIHESNDINQINESKKLFRSNLLKYAKDVSEKYIDVPNTTDFAVIFLPLEGLYLEALNMGLFEEIQSKYKVNLTGPTTFTAFINSLNMGFKSLMIQKKSADVFKLLGAIKTEFSKFADALDKTQKKVNAAADELDELVGKRTRMMNSKLKSIDAISESEAKLLLDENSSDN